LSAAAGLALARGVPLAAVDPAELRRRLADAGAIVDWE
jgi:hypothetical protein